MSDAETPQILDQPVRPGRRRPQLEDFDAIFDLMRENMSLSSACRKLGFDQPSATKMLRLHPELGHEYERAREDRGDLMGEQGIAIIQGVLTGKISPDRARVALDGIKWAAGQMAPKRWNNNRVQAEVNGAGGGPIQVVINGPDANL